MNAWSKNFLRIGHAGAGHYAKPNTLKSIALALEMGVDMVEFDVRPCRDALVLTHNDFLLKGDKRLRISELCYDEIRTLDASKDEHIPKLTDALDIINGRALMNVDLKDRGYEDAVVDVLRERRVLGDALFSSLLPDSLAKIRARVPDARTSISYPTDRANASQRPLLQPIVQASLRGMRWTLPYRILAMIARARANAATLHYQVISPTTLSRVHRIGGKVFAWTVDEANSMRALRTMGVDGISSNRPDLFAQM